jgi:hypothetical protein
VQASLNWPGTASFISLCLVVDSIKVTKYAIIPRVKVRVYGSNDKTQHRPAPDFLTSFCSGTEISLCDGHLRGCGGGARPQSPWLLKQRRPAAPRETGCGPTAAATRGDGGRPRRRRSNGLRGYWGQRRASGAEGGRRRPSGLRGGGGRWRRATQAVSLCQSYLSLTSGRRRGAGRPVGILPQR